MINEDRYDTKKVTTRCRKATLHIIDGLDWNLNLSYQTNSIFIVTIIVHKPNFQTYLLVMDKPIAAH